MNTESRVVLRCHGFVWLFLSYSCSVLVTRSYMPLCVSLSLQPEWNVCASESHRRLVKRFHWPIWKPVYETLFCHELQRLRGYCNPRNTHCTWDWRFRARGSNRIFEFAVALPSDGAATFPTNNPLIVVSRGQVAGRPKGGLIQKSPG